MNGPLLVVNESAQARGFLDPSLILFSISVSSNGEIGTSERSFSLEDSISLVLDGSEFAFELPASSVFGRGFSGTQN